MKLSNHPAEIIDIKKISEKLKNKIILKLFFINIIIEAVLKILLR